MLESHLYSVPNHIHACHFDDQTVILDLKADKYQLLGGETAKAFRAISHSCHQNDQSPTCTQQSLEELGKRTMKSLVLSGLLERKIEEVANRQTISPETAHCHARNLPISRPHKLSFICGWRASLATADAAFSQRFLPIIQIISSLKTKKKRIANNENYTLQDVPWQMSNFLSYRPFLYSHRSKCYLDSLVIMKYLLSVGINSKWVYGVRLNPFLAHCWVEAEGFVVNDTVERISDYKPIMVV